MTLVIGNMPEEPDQLARWLDHQLVGHHLGELVAELSAVQETGPRTVALNDVLGSSLAEVLEHGLGVLPESTVQQLLRQPQLLLQLQERVFIEGGPYWRQLPRSAELTERSQAILQRALQQLRLDRRPTLDRVRRIPMEVYLRWGVSLAVAVVLVLVVQRVGLQWRGGAGPSRPNWGWAQGLPSANDSRTYLEALAQQAEQWYLERPMTPDSLVRRLGEFRQGCGALLIAPHPPLSPAQRADLWESCRKWSATIDELIVRAQQGEDVATVRQEADELVRKLTGALRGRIAERDAS